MQVIEDKINTVNEMYTIFTAIKETSGKNDKVQIIANHADNETFKYFLNFLYNDMITTGLSAKKINKDLKRDYVHTIRGFDNPQDMMDFVSNYNTGTDDIIEVCQSYLRKLEEPYGTFMKEVLTKSYKCGITSSSVNKAIKGLIPEFKVQLAFPYEKYADKITGDFVLTQKLDGHRTLAFYDGEKVTFRTRKGHEITGMTELEDEFKAFFPVANGRSIVVDGEVTVANKTVPIDKIFQETSKIIRKDGTKTGLKFHVFDVLPEDEFWNGQSVATYFERRGAINHLFAKSLYQPNLVTLVKELYRGNKQNMIPKFMKIANENGWEGLMLNACSEPYSCKRTKGLLKVKQFHSCDGVVKDIYEGSSKYAGKLGGIVITFEDQLVNIGSGFTDEERELYWNNPELIIGKVGEYQYFERTENQKGGTDLRFATWKGIREDKGVGDLNYE